MSQTGSPARLAAVRSRIAAAAEADKRAGRRGDPRRRHQDLRRRAHRARARGRPPRLWREPRAGGQGQMAGAAARLSRHRAASDRSPAIQQGQGGRALFDAIHTIDRPKIAAGRRRARWPSRASGWSSSSRSTPARSRRRPACCRKEAAGLAAPVPRGAQARHRRPDVHPAARRGARRAFRLPRQARRTSWASQQLSMGMSADFETAIAFGATHVRVGSQIFGRRA